MNETERGLTAFWSYLADKAGRPTATERPRALRVLEVRPDSSKREAVFGLVLHVALLAAVATGLSADLPLWRRLLSGLACLALAASIVDIARVYRRL